MSEFITATKQNSRRPDVIDCSKSECPPNLYGDGSLASCGQNDLDYTNFCYFLDPSACGQNVIPGYISIDWRDRAANGRVISDYVNCKIDANAYLTLGDVNEYIEFFSKDPTFDLATDPGFNSFIAPRFCSIYRAPAINCPGNSNVACSAFVSNDEAGRLCQNWAANPANSSAVTASMNEYCSKNPSSSDCACIAPNNPVYNSLSGVSVPAVCWYTPCKSGNTIKYPSQLDTVCPTQESICSSLNSYIGQKGVDINSDQLLVASGCKLEEPTYTIWIILGVLVILFIAFIIYFVFTSSPTTTTVYPDVVDLSTYRTAV
jgi:hypothetical protein